MSKLSKSPGHGGKSIFAQGRNRIDTDNLPKVGQKTYKEITKTSVVELPVNHIKPVNGRMFVISKDPGEMKTEGGIILPTDYNAPEAKGGKSRKLRRYFVVDVANDCNLKITRGDEVYPFIPQEAEEWSFPEIHDFFNGLSYLVIHESELAGIALTSLLKKEKK